MEEVEERERQRTGREEVEELSNGGGRASLSFVSTTFALFVLSS